MPSFQDSGCVGNHQPRVPLRSTLGCQMSSFQDSELRFHTYTRKLHQEKVVGKGMLTRWANHFVRFPGTSH